MADQKGPDICDYEGSTYRTDFWEGRGREYEDRVERIAIRRLLPEAGKRLLELGAGFGRLTPLFAGYDLVVLLDYSRSQLAYARESHGDDGYLYVAANLYNMPFAPGLFETATMVRVLHHMQDPPAALESVRRVMAENGVFLIEYANKRNLKTVGRWLLGRQNGNPFDRETVVLGDVYYGFHPYYVRKVLGEAGFEPNRMLTVSHYRLSFLKRTVPTDLLVTLDSLAQWTGGLWQYSPSVFVRNRTVGSSESAPDGAFWRCPACGSLSMEETDEGLRCADCGTRWAKRNGIYDFKEPVEP